MIIDLWEIMKFRKKGGLFALWNRKNPTTFCTTKNVFLILRKKKSRHFICLFETHPSFSWTSVLGILQATAKNLRIAIIPWCREWTLVNHDCDALSKGSLGLQAPNKLCIQRALALEHCCDTHFPDVGDLKAFIMWNCGFSKCTAPRDEQNAWAVLGPGSCM